MIQSDYPRRGGYADDVTGADSGGKRDGGKGGESLQVTAQVPGGLGLGSLLPSGTFFNDNDLFVAHWIQALFPDAIVNPRSITDLNPASLIKYRAVHLFGGAGWAHALELAGWPKELSVWTGSCPCQPFSTAGKRGGTDDARHLWPEMLRLVAECRPPVIFGEQVASKLGREWLAGVRADLEALGYAVGAADLCAASVGAPHIRQRLYWVAYSRRFGDERWREPREFSGSASEAQGSIQERERRGDALTDSGATGGLANTNSRQRGWLSDGTRRDDSYGQDARWAEGNGQPKRSGTTGDSSRLGNPNDPRPQGWLLRRNGTRERFTRQTGLGPWGNYDLIECLDGKTRRFESGSFPLAYGDSSRVGRIRAYGNAIVAPLAAAFIGAFMEAVGITPEKEQQHGLP